MNNEQHIEKLKKELASLGRFQALERQKLLMEIQLLRLELEKA